MAAALVQHRSTQGTTSEASRALAFTGACGAGNTIVVAIASFKSGAAATFTVSDDQGHSSYTSLKRSPESSGFVCELFGFANTTAATFTITVTPNANAFLTFSIAEYSGMPTSLQADGSNAASGSGTTPATGSATTTATGLAVGVVTHNGSSITITEGGGFSLVEENENTTSAIPFSSTYQVTAASTSYNASWTLSGSAAWECALALLKDSGGGGGATQPIASSLALMGLQ